jgi:signal transduction histidine kinase
MGLATALRGYLEAQADRTGLAIAMDGGSDLPPISSEVAITAFRVTQEAVTNAVRHAAASAVRVALRSNASGLEISVDDDGNGFDVRATIGQSASKALGLLGMQERVRLLGGEVRIVSEPGAGTRIHVQLPFEVGS